MQKQLNTNHFEYIELNNLNNSLFQLIIYNKSTVKIYPKLYLLIYLDFENIITTKLHPLNKIKSNIVNNIEIVYIKTEIVLNIPDNNYVYFKYIF